MTLAKRVLLNACCKYVYRQRHLFWDLTNMVTYWQTLSEAELEGHWLSIHKKG